MFIYILGGDIDISIVPRGYPMKQLDPAEHFWVIQNVKHRPLQSRCVKQLPFPIIECDQQHSSYEWLNVNDPSLVCAGVSCIAYSVYLVYESPYLNGSIFEKCSPCTALFHAA